MRQIFVGPGGVRPVQVGARRWWLSLSFGVTAAAAAAFIACNARVDPVTTVASPNVRDAAVIDADETTTTTTDQETGDVVGDVAGDVWTDQQVTNTVDSRTANVLAWFAGIALVVTTVGQLAYVVLHRFGWFRRVVDRGKGRKCWDPAHRHRPGAFHE